MDHHFADEEGRLLSDHQLVDDMIQIFKRRLENEDYSRLGPAEEQQLRLIDVHTSKATWAVPNDQLRYLSLVDHNNRARLPWSASSEAEEQLAECAFCGYETPDVANTKPSCGHVYCAWCLATKALLEAIMAEEGQEEDKPCVCLAEGDSWKTLEWTPRSVTAVARGLLAYVKARQTADLMEEWALSRQLQLIELNGGDIPWQEGPILDLNDTRKCTACMDEIPANNGTTLACRHDWCVECLSGNIRQAMTSRASWPPKCCDDFTDDEIDEAVNLIGDDLAMELEEKKEELTSTNPTFCTRPDCGGFLPKKAEEEGDSPFAACPLCEESVCHRCKSPRSEHGNSSDNNNDNKFGCPPRAGKGNEGLFSEGAMQQCPRCACPVEKSDGCDHMKCEQCDQDFCYRCGDSLVAPFYRCRPECGGGAPQWYEVDDEAGEVDEFLAFDDEAGEGEMELGAPRLEDELDLEVADVHFADLWDFKDAGIVLNPGW